MQRRNLVTNTLMGALGLFGLGTLFLVAEAVTASGLELLTGRNDDDDGELAGSANISSFGRNGTGRSLGGDDEGSEKSVRFSMIAPVYLAAGFLSIVSTAVITWLYMTTPSLRNEHASTMIQIITICDLMFTLKFTTSALVYEIDSGDQRRSFHLFADRCLSAAAYEQFWGMAVIAWNSCWMFDLMLILRNPLRNTKKFAKLYHLMTVVLCCSTTVAVLMKNHRGSSDYTCWIRAEKDNFWTLDLFLYISFGLAICSLLYARSRLNHGTAATIELRKTMFKRHSMYVIAYLFLWLWPATHYIWDKKDRKKWITVIDALTTSGQAAIFAMVRLSEPSAWLLFLNKTKLIRFDFLIPNVASSGEEESLRRRGSSRTSLSGVGREESSMSLLTEPERSRNAPLLSTRLDHTQLLLTGTDAESRAMSTYEDTELNNWSLLLKPRDQQDEEIQNVNSHFMFTEEHKSPETNRFLQQPLLIKNNPENSNGIYNSMYIASPHSERSATQRTSDAGDEESSDYVHFVESSEVYSSDNRWKAVRTVSKTLIGSTGQAWDMGSGLRLELGMCMLSGICQTLLPFGENSYSPKKAEENRERASSGIDLGNRGKLSATFSDSDSDLDSMGGSMSENIESDERDGAANLARPLTPDTFQRSQKRRTSAKRFGHFRRNSHLSVLETSPACSTKYCRLLTKFRKISDFDSYVLENSSVGRSVSPSSGEERPILKSSKSFSHGNLYEKALKLSARKETSEAPSHQGMHSPSLSQFSAPRERLGSDVHKMAKQDEAQKQSEEDEVFKVCSFEDKEFALLRDLAGVSVEDLVSELDPYRLQKGQIRAHFSEGASSSFFCRSYNQQFMVKTITSHEVETLINLLPSYVAHLKNYPDSLLCRFYGCFELKSAGIKNYFILMGNAFPCIRFPSKWEIYDLKGSSVGRRKRVSESMEVSGKKPRKHRRVLYQDEDFQSIHRDGFLPPPEELLEKKDKYSSPYREVIDQLVLDVKLLQQFGLMDYSLLVNVMPIQDNGDPTEQKILEQTSLPFSLRHVGHLSVSAARHIYEVVTGEFSGKKAKRDSSSRSKNLIKKRGSNTNAVVHPHTGAQDMLRNFHSRPQRSSPLVKANVDGNIQLCLDATKKISRWSSYSVIPVLSRRNLTTTSKINAEVEAEKKETEPIVSIEEDSEHTVVDEKALIQIGIIDVLQPYDLSKRLEKGFKILRHASWSIDVSSVDPARYAKRFTVMVRRMFNDRNYLEIEEEDETT